MIWYGEFEFFDVTELLSRIAAFQIINVKSGAEYEIDH